MKWLDEHDGPVWRYRSTLRPITQLPLAKLDALMDPANIGPDVRDLVTARELTPAECKQLDLEPVTGWHQPNAKDLAALHSRVRTDEDIARDTLDARDHVRENAAREWDMGQRNRGS